jgi:hypothetical protein
VIDDRVDTLIQDGTNLTWTYDDTANTLTGNVTRAALTRVDDTNVTLTLGGAPSTAVLTATSITVGWSGTLSLARGGTGAALVDPGADRILFWDDSAGAVAFLTPGNGLTITTTTVAVDSASDTVDGIIEIAIQSEMEAASSTTLAVTPGRQHFHPSAAKAWGRITYSGSTPQVAASYNITSVGDTGTGVSRPALTNAMSSSSYVVIANNEQEEEARGVPINTTTVEIQVADSGGTNADYNHSFLVFGDM